MSFNLACPITKPFLTLLFKTLKRRKNQVYTPKFTGLYAFWRPYWRDTERNIKKFQTYRKKIPLNPMNIQANAIKNHLPYGEDAFLHDNMKRKHRVIHLADIGALDLGASLAQSSGIEFLRGEFAAIKNVKWLDAILLHVYLFRHFQYFRGYCYGKRVR